MGDERATGTSDPSWLDSWPGPLIFGGVGAVYAGLSQYVIVLNDPVHLGAGFWPAAGLTTAALLLLPTRRWPWVLSAVAVAELGLDLLHGYPLAASLWWTAGNGLGPFTGALLVRRFVHPRGALVPVDNLLGFVLFGVFLGSLAGASVGSVGTIAVIGNPMWQVWPKYVIGDGLGVLVVAPLLLTWDEAMPRRSRLESAALLFLLAAVPLATFRNWDAAWDLALPHLMTPLLIWTALRFGIRGTAWAVMWIAQIANWTTANGYGPFAMAGGPEGHAVTSLQMFLAITSVSVFILAVLITDLARRTEAERDLAREAERLRRAVARRATGLQVHDKVVQLLSTVSFALQLDDRETALAATEAATTEAQLIVSDLLADMAIARGGVQPGDLVTRGGIRSGDADEVVL